MRIIRSVKIDRAHPIEYTMPLKRPYGTARGVTNASTSFLIRLHATHIDGSLIGVGEAQPRRKLTGDISTDAAWEFFKRAARSLVGIELKFSDTKEAVEEVRRVMRDLRTLATAMGEESNSRKPFRGSLLGFEVALLDLAARSMEVSIGDLLGRKRDDVEITVRTLSTQNTLEQFKDRVKRQAQAFPMVRVKGQGHLQNDRKLLRLIHETNCAAGVNKPIWMDLNEGYEPDEAKEFIDGIVRDSEAGLLPSIISLEQPIHHSVGDKLPDLQRYADALTEKSSAADIRIMPDESIWDIQDLERIHENGGCRAINIKTAKAGGLLASLELAERAIEINPDTNICIGGMVGTSDVTTWSLLHLGRALPRLDYITAVPPSGLSQFWVACSLRVARARATLSSMDSAVAVHT